MELHRNEAVMQMKTDIETLTQIFEESNETFGRFKANLVELNEESKMGLSRRDICHLQQMGTTIEGAIKEMGSRVEKNCRLLAENHDRFYTNRTQIYLVVDGATETQVEVFKYGRSMLEQAEEFRNIFDNQMRRLKRCQ